MNHNGRLFVERVCQKKISRIISYQDFFTIQHAAVQVVTLGPAIVAVCGPDAHAETTHIYLPPHLKGVISSTLADKIHRSGQTVLAELLREFQMEFGVKEVLGCDLELLRAPVIQPRAPHGSAALKSVVGFSCGFKTATTTTTAITITSATAQRRSPSSLLFLLMKFLPLLSIVNLQTSRPHNDKIVYQTARFLSSA